MSRNGRLFFYFSTAFFADRKVKILKARYGADGILLYLYLLCEIYRAEGYYLQYDDDAEYLIADELGMNYEKIGQILNFLLERSLFDNTLFKSDKVLTSREIQLTFQDAVKGMASKNPVKVIERLWLLEKNETAAYIQTQPENGISEKVNSFSEKSTDISEKSDVKQRKVKKSKESKVKQSKAEQRDPSEVSASAAAAASQQKMIEKSFSQITGRLFTTSDDAALSELHDMGAADALILRVMENVAKQRHSPITSMRYFVPIVCEAMRQTGPGGDGKQGLYEGTSNIDEIERVLNEEWAKEVQKYDND